jgi:S-adenosylmethionine:tRNA ribosyltransferase-isomerase
MVRLRLSCAHSDAPDLPADVDRAIDRLGRMPVPPYIRRPQAGPEADALEEVDRRRYQTVYASAPGAVAAPTAGLHFTAELLQAIRAAGVAVQTLTLQVGPGTFLPLRTPRVRDHAVPAESFCIGEALAEAVARTRRTGGRVVAVGTTVVRALETAAEPDGGVRAGEGRTDLFITPGYAFSAVDALVTNFHLPRSTLIMLVAAFLGDLSWRRVYQAAVDEDYRFYSYGDAMFIE